MQEAIANLVHPVLIQGLQLKDRLSMGEEPQFEIEQAALKGLLLSDIEARHWADFGGDAGQDLGLEGRPRSDRAFLGIRYALTCWVDELFTLNSPWASRWNERKLEVALYATNDRAWKFWEQARLAEARAGTDAIEAFYLCVMLGFRGELREEPERLSAWGAAARAQIGRGRGGDWPYPPELEPPSNVPPLSGASKLRRMILTGGVVLLIIVPLMAVLVQRLR